MGAIATVVPGPFLSGIWPAVALVAEAAFRKWGVRGVKRRGRARRLYSTIVRSLCTPLALVAALAAGGAAADEPELESQDGRGFIVDGGERIEAAAQLIFDHRASANAGGAPRTMPVRWSSDATATLTTPDGALDVALKLSAVMWARSRSTSTAHGSDRPGCTWLRSS